MVQRRRSSGASHVSQQQQRHGAVRQGAAHAVVAGGRRRGSRSRARSPPLRAQCRRGRRLAGIGVPGRGCLHRPGKSQTDQRQSSLSRSFLFFPGLFFASAASRFSRARAPWRRAPQFLLSRFLIGLLAALRSNDRPIHRMHVFVVPTSPRYVLTTRLADGSTLTATLRSAPGPRLLAVELVASAGPARPTEQDRHAEQASQQRTPPTSISPHHHPAHCPSLEKKILTVCHSPSYEKGVGSWDDNHEL